MDGSSSKIYVTENFPIYVCVCVCVCLFIKSVENHKHWRIELATGCFQGI